jgi:N-acylneuraminate cytidylyltransferase
MKILGLIIARSGSKSVPNKNMKILAGKPLLQYTIDSALEANCFQDLIFSTDSKEYADFVHSNGVIVPFLRPNELSKDTTPTVDVVIHAVQYMKTLNKHYDGVCLLQPTYPFRKSGFIDLAYQKFINSHADSLISVLPLPHQYNPHWVFSSNNKNYLSVFTGEEQPISRRQDLPNLFFRDGAIYITKTSTLINSHSLFGKQISFIETDPRFYINIDTLIDWNLAEDKIKELHLT